MAAALLLALALTAAVGVANALRPRRSVLLALPSWIAAWATIELAPHLLVLSTIEAGALIAFGALDETVGWVGLGILAATEAFALACVLHARSTAVGLAAVLEDLDPDPPDRARFPRSHIVFPWLMFRRRGVRHERGVVYWRAPSGRPLKLDVYLPTAPATKPGPAIIEVHGGGWILGSRKEQGIPLLNHLAANGWVGFNIDYRLSPFATFPDHVVDVKRAIAWVREHAEEYGVDPGFIAITGGSAGGHLTALAALTADDKTLQPGFEEADTSVQAAVSFYGAYDFLDDETFTIPKLRPWVLEPIVFKAWRDEHPERFRDASPRHRVHANAPPFFIIHGQRDTLIRVHDARRFAGELKEISRNPVLYAEMKGGQHAFDLIPSWRTVPVTEGIERFLTHVHARRAEHAAGGERRLEEQLT